MMGKEPHGVDDFEYWANLAKTDPEQFEQERKQLLEKFIAESPQAYQDRLKRIQWRVDRERERASNPLSSCVRLHQMMMDSVCGEEGLIHALRNVVHGNVGNKNTLTRPQRGAVLPFVKKEK
ncbi:MAG: DUF3135 domain-containing protein [Minisyncoccota bacterium]